MTVDTVALTPAEIEAELRRIIGALCYEVDRTIADDVYLRVRELIRQAALPLEAEQERVRVLTAALQEIYAIDETTSDDCEAVIRMVDCAMAALATAGGEGQERVLTRRETLEAAIRALGYAVPFTYGDEKQAARLTASVHAGYLHAHGVDLPLAEIRDACGLPSAAEEGVTP